jgi:hypothetical protein
MSNFLAARITGSEPGAKQEMFYFFSKSAGCLELISEFIPAENRISQPAISAPRVTITSVMPPPAADIADHNMQFSTRKRILG